MKVFIIYNNKSNTVMAITEDKKLAEIYVDQNNWKNDQYQIVKIVGDTANRCLIDYDELYLEFDDDIDKVLTQAESEIIGRILQEEQSRIDDTLKDIHHYLTNYQLKPKERTVLEEANDTLQKLKKKKHIRRAVNINTFVHLMTNDKHFIDVIRESLYETGEKIIKYLYKK